ncbi:MAG: alpha/beta hydrolase family protein [Planctomycetota bacterium]
MNSAIKPLILSVTLSCLSALHTNAQDDRYTLPGLLGPLRVGTLAFHWIDDSRLEGGTVDPQDHRELRAQIWYPAQVEEGAPRAPHTLELDSYREVYNPQLIAIIERIKTNSVLAAKPERGPFPVLLFSHGWQATGSGYTSLMENLASQGFIAVGIDHPFLGRVLLESGEITEPSEAHFRSNEDTVACYSKDQLFALDRLQELNRDHPSLTGKLNLDRVASMGHSSGVHAAAGAARRSGKIKASILIDGFSNSEAFNLQQDLLLLRTGRAVAPNERYSEMSGGRVWDSSFQLGSHTSCMDAEYVHASKKAARERAKENLIWIARICATFLEASFTDDHSRMTKLRGDLPEEITLEQIRLD